MTLARYLLWFICVLAWFSLLCALKYPFRKKRMIPIRIIIIVVKALLTVFTAYEVMVDESPVVYRLSFVLASLYVALFGDTLGDIIALPIMLLKKKGNNLIFQVVASAVCVITYLIAGTVNMQTVSANRFDVKSDKITEDYKVVFVSDLHVGSSQSLKTTQKTIDKIASEKPDLVLLGGDITDEMTTKEEMEEVYRLIGKLEAPVYFIYGNHDRQPDHFGTVEEKYSEDELINAISSNGITILKDEWINFSDELVIFGREDYSSEDRKALSDIDPRPEGCFVLQIDHSPYEKDDITNSGSDLQLSGHSHAGQIFPLKALYTVAGYDAYGFFHYGDTELYVSSGASGWSFPFRTENKCYYEVITLEPES